MLPVIYIITYIILISQVLYCFNNLLFYLCEINSFSALLQVLIKIDELLDMLIENPELTIGEQVTEETESLEKPPFLVRGCVLTIVDRMDEEFIKLLKVCPDYHASFSSFHFLSSH